MDFRKALLALLVSATVCAPYASADTVDFGPYMKSLESRIQSKFQIDDDKVSRRVVVDFNVLQNGSVENARIAVPSKDPQRNAAALAAVNAAGPFDPLPEGSPKQITIRFTFAAHMSARTLRALEQKELTDVPAGQKAAMLNNKGVQALSRGDSDGAIRCFQEALQLEPDYEYARLNLAIAYNNKALKLPAKTALGYFHQALVMQPTNETTWKNFHECLKAAQDAPEVAQMVQEQVAKTTKDSSADQHISMGIAWEMQREWSKAAAEYELAKAQGRSADAQRLIDTMPSRQEEAK